ncbi:uncharacterized [Tachysurus ichikawai]
MSRPVSHSEAEKHLKAKRAVAGKSSCFPTEESQLSPLDTFPVCVLPPVLLMLTAISFTPQSQREAFPPQPLSHIIEQHRCSPSESC